MSVIPTIVPPVPAIPPTRQDLEHAAPPWFAQSMAPIMVQTLAPIHQQLGRIELSLLAVNLQAMRAFNRSAIHPDDALSSY
jgi:hypothetical protein